MEKSFAWWLVKIDRVAAWILLATILLFFISGYGITKGLIDPGAAYLLHNSILPAVGLVTFSIHTFLAVRLALMRWRRWNTVSAGSLAFIYLGFFIVLAYVGYAYEPPAAAPASSNTQSNPQTTGDPVGQAIESETQTTSGTEQPAAKTFTADELAKYDGKNGNPAYIAIDGNVYDVSTLFVNGIHHGCTAGREVSAGFWAVKKHLKSMLADYPVVGNYITTN